VSCRADELYVQRVQYGYRCYRGLPPLCRPREARSVARALPTCRAAWRWWRRPRKRSRRERAGEVGGGAEGGGTDGLGWEFLIASGEMEELGEPALRRYFALHGLSPPRGRLQMLQAIRAHHSQALKNKDWGALHTESDHLPRFNVEEGEDAEDEVA